MIEPAAAAMLAIGIDEVGEDIQAERSLLIRDTDRVVRCMAVVVGPDVSVDWALVERVADQPDNVSFDYGLARLLIAVRDKTWKDMPK